ncbi:prolipoprotein diacylglyceryl transferase [Anianabacter salinae]|uniref:prolipoprotein diacylglyceryl transferase n=1 Tax=Anianabacter salinae TaxID=2851023 RepID=UPI00225E3B5E|nr:prolipoprotein diacylglyceryl transferase [Anianabacter salinae]MBV0912617.1 prolipoprotein diacylglyceryl transferase [Anianabacter salinae]
MLAAIPFPDLSPEIFTIEIGGFAFDLRWYALAYIVGILIGWRIAVAAVRRPQIWPGSHAPMTPQQVDDLLTMVILGVIIGGRLGFVIFYQPGYYLANPVDIVKIWTGGMSFHGGMLGVVAALVWFCRRNSVRLLSAADMLAIATPAGLLLGRIANFINAELWGRPTNLPWGVIFPGAAAQTCPGVEGPCARHPSQLYEAGLEGLLLGALVLVAAFVWWWTRRPGQVTGLFLAGYGAARFVVEYFRQADAQFITPGNPWGHVVRLGETGITMGQLLSLPMVLAGVALILWARRRP